MSPRWPPTRKPPFRHTSPSGFGLRHPDTVDEQTRADTPITSLRSVYNRNQREHKLHKMPGTKQLNSGTRDPLTEEQTISDHTPRSTRGAPETDTEDTLEDKPALA